MTFPLNINSYSAYRAALALNNMSISMLQQGQPRAAVKTLSEALSLLRAVLDENNQASSSARLHVAQQQLQMASQQLAKQPQQSCCVSPSHIQVLEDQDFYHIHQAAMPCTTNPITATFIRVRESHFTENCSFERGQAPSQTDLYDMERMFGILLYNHGMAFFCLWQDQPAASFLSRAFQSLRLAHVVHMRVWNSGDAAPPAQHLYLRLEHVPSVLSSALALRSLSQVAQHLHTTLQEAQQAHQAAYELCAWVSQHESLFSVATTWGDSSPPMLAPAA